MFYLLVKYLLFIYTFHFILFLFPRWERFLSWKRVISQSKPYKLWRKLINCWPRLELTNLGTPFFNVYKDVLSIRISDQTGVCPDPTFGREKMDPTFKNGPDFDLGSDKIKNLFLPLYNRYVNAV